MQTFACVFVYEYAKTFSVFTLFTSFSWDPFHFSSWSRLTGGGEGFPLSPGYGPASKNRWQNGFQKRIRHYFYPGNEMKYDNESKTQILRHLKPPKKVFPNLDLCNPMELLFHWTNV